MRRRKLGKFYVTREFFDDRGDCLDGLNLFEGFLPLSATQQFPNQVTEYIGYHEDFEELEQGADIPVYQAFFFDYTSKPSWVKSH